MKKIFTIVCSLILCFSIAACSCNNEKEKVVLEDVQYSEGEGSIIYLNSYDAIQEKVNDKKTFVFYMYGATCYGCYLFTPIITEYVKDAKLNVYAVEVMQVIAAKNTNDDLASKLEGTPAVAIFKDGELYEYLSGNREGQADYLETKEGLASWFEKYVELK